MSDDLKRQLREGDHFEKVMSAPRAADRIEELEAKLAKVTAAYRLEAMKRDDYSHDAFDKQLAELIGGKDEWRCPIGYEGCTKNCGGYGCGN